MFNHAPRLAEHVVFGIAIKELRSRKNISDRTAVISLNCRVKLLVQIFPTFRRLLRFELLGAPSAAVRKHVLSIVRHLPPLFDQCVDRLNHGKCKLAIPLRIPASCKNRQILPAQHISLFRLASVAISANIVHPFCSDSFAPNTIKELLC